MNFRFFLNLLLAASFWYSSANARTGYYHKQPDTTEAVKAADGLIRRWLPGAREHFILEKLNMPVGHDVFELESADGKIILRGNNGVSLASAFNFYLKNYLHCDISWNGVNLKLQRTFPVITKKIHKESPYRYRYYLNYCTFNYSMTWWKWDRWQQEIDWMALNGINMPLAITGQNLIWQKVYHQLGFSDQELSSFFSGPAYTNWFWMGNLDGWGGPLQQDFIDSQARLQLQILKREREFGMKAILPAFTGHVPATFAKKYPKAHLKKINWGANFSSTYLLDPDDPLFLKIGTAFIREETKYFGTDHYYSADTFNENAPPTNDSLFLSHVSKQVYQSMAQTDSSATWVMQGWLFVNNPTFWKPTQIRALLNAVPDRHLLLLDLWSETRPVWNRTQAYYGKPWIWCMLHNFGGNIGLYGRMQAVADGPAAAARQRGSGQLQGMGVAPEGIEQNPAIYALMLDHVWTNRPIDLDDWLKNYTWRRYGSFNWDLLAAWQVIRKTAYNGGQSEGAPESIITGRPTFDKETVWTKTELNYHRKDLLPAWRLFISASGQMKHSDGYQYDLVDLTRQVLADYADTLQQKITADYKRKDLRAFEENSRAFLELISDMDRLLGTRKDFLLGRWLSSAKSWGTNARETALYEKNARDLITLWGHRDEPLHDYACKQWSGMLNGFYKPRWEMFFRDVRKAVLTGKGFDQKAFEKHVSNWEWQWVNAHQPYPTVPEGNAVHEARRLFAKYNQVISQ